MKAIRSLVNRWIMLIIIASTFTASAFAEQVLHSFAGAPDGAYPGNGLIADKKGNLYGTVGSGGANGGGAVFELSPLRFPAIPGSRL